MFVPHESGIAGASITWHSTAANSSDGANRADTQTQPLANLCGSQEETPSQKTPS
jgi:hypothetical protein